MTVVCYGDSNTYGYDPRSYFGGRYPKDCRWVDILAAKTGWDIQNIGMNGQEIPPFMPKLPLNTDLLIVMLGTNDLMQGNSPEQVANRMKTFLSMLSINKRNVLLIAPPPLQIGEWVPNQTLIDDSKQLALCYLDLAQRHDIRFADAGEWNISIAFDGAHFTEEGHRVFAERLYAKLRSEAAEGIGSIELPV